MASVGALLLLDLGVPAFACFPWNFAVDDACITPRYAISILGGHIFVHNPAGPVLEK